MRTGHGDGFLENDGVGARDALDVDMGVALDGHAKGVVDEQPCVEPGQGLNIRDMQVLRDVDCLELFGGGRREVDLGERRVGLVILEIHDALEGIDVGVNGTVGLDGAVDGHGQALRLGLRNNDTVKDKLGIVDLLLRNLGNGNQEAEDDGQYMALGMHDTHEICHLHTRHDNDDDDHNCNQIRPPEFGTVTQAAALPGLLRDILRLGNGGLIDVAHG